MPKSKTKPPLWNVRVRLFDNAANKLAGDLNVSTLAPDPGAACPKAYEVAAGMAQKILPQVHAVDFFVTKGDK